MCYYLGELTLGSQKLLQIDQKHYEKIRLHKKFLVGALGIEERFDILLNNYLEFEEDLLIMALKAAVISTRQPNIMHARRREMNRRIANFLTSARLYLDQLKGDIKNIFGKDAAQTKALKAEISAHYDKSFSYRLMETLRNYLQHKGLAAHSIAITYQLTEKRQGAPVACTVTPLMKKEHFLADKNLKKEVKEEIVTLAELPDLIDLKPHVREYMECLNSINNYVRLLLEPECIVWEETICNTIKDFKNKLALSSDVDVSGLMVFRCAGQMPSPIIEKEDIFLEFNEYRKHLKTTNSVTKNLTNIFATGTERDLLKSQQCEAD